MIRNILACVLICLIYSSSFASANYNPLKINLQYNSSGQYGLNLTNLAEYNLQVVTITLKQLNSQPKICYTTDVNQLLTAKTSYFVTIPKAALNECSDQRRTTYTSTPQDANNSSNNILPITSNTGGCMAIEYEYYLNGNNNDHHYAIYPLLCKSI